MTEKIKAITFSCPKSIDIEYLDDDTETNLCVYQDYILEKLKQINIYSKHGIYYLFLAMQR